MERFLMRGAGWRSSLSTAGPWRWTFRGTGGRGEILRPGRRPERFPCPDPLPVLRELLGARGRVPAVGYLGYEAFASPAERRRRGPSPAPDFLWFQPERLVVHPRRPGERMPKPVVAERSGNPAFAFGEGRRLRDPGLEASHRLMDPAPDQVPGEAIFRRGDEARYQAGVRRVLRYIAAGDVYQANLSHALRLPARGLDPRAYFDRLHALNPSPYALYLDAGGFQLASNSPELLLRARGGRVETRPIAGTCPPEREGELLLSPKERAEHVMLLDLERNDLGRVCRPGSVRVTERMTLERYSHVTHIVSHVEGRLAPGFDGFDAVRAVFPGGTITGCPKARCMEILAELERSPRGPFYGAAGWIAPGGDCELNILIRTALFRAGRMTARLGAGVVADSDPAREWRETLHKAGALLAAYRGLVDIRRRHVRASSA